MRVEDRPSREAGVTLEAASARAAVLVVVPGDSVTGHALTLLLATDAYGAKPVSLASLQDPSGAALLLGEARLVILMPTMSAAQRDGVVELSRRGGQGGVPVPVLELGRPPEGSRLLPDYSVPWPCRSEDLQRRIEAALGAATRGAGGGGGAVGEAEP